MRLDNQRGFTLIELMIALGVALVLAVLAAPTFRDLIIKSRLRGATDGITSLLNSARANAVKLQRQVNVSVQGTSTWCAGGYTEPVSTTPGVAATLSNAPCDCSGSPNTCVVDSQLARVSSDDYSGVTLSSITGSILFTSAASGGGGVTFDPKVGALTSLLNGGYDSPQITITSDRYSTQITVSPLGQTVVCTPSTSSFVSGYPSC